MSVWFLTIYCITEFTYLILLFYLYIYLERTWEFTPK